MKKPRQSNILLGVRRVRGQSFFPMQVTFVKQINLAMISYFSNVFLFHNNTRKVLSKQNFDGCLKRREQFPIKLMPL